jgi:hypothetical protein
MSKGGDPVPNYELFLAAKKLTAGSNGGRPSLSLSPIFILCDACYWCATYLDKRRTPIDNCCPQCNNNNNELTSFPIDYNTKYSIIST